MRGQLRVYRMLVRYIRFDLVLTWSKSGKVLVRFEFFGSCEHLLEALSKVVNLILGADFGYSNQEVIVHALIVTAEW